MKTGSELPSLRYEGRLAALAFSPDGRLLAGAGDDHLARVWSVAGDTQVAKRTAGANPKAKKPAPMCPAVLKASLK
ncbi:hypothetical protein [Myxococcus qinghaiensis]|uniref:hypothetical protein n=1 Tax=Myxococcus qinghaiensis TaxID=2906758 RepID=UPI0020A71701|nr:hypothetical protein [Myxococcus qinghaiensis]MCP3162114.1 hypothetical protein [Myxococcus qinghaiensis]